MVSQCQNDYFDSRCLLASPHLRLSQISPSPIFFWNPWVRRILGVGYVGFLLAWIPFFRRKLFEPFKPSLLADAGLDNFNPQTYFPESQVKVPSAEKPQAITQVLPSITGQIVLEGDSGLGKSMFLRHLVKTSPRIVKLKLA